MLDVENILYKEAYLMPIFLDNINIVKRIMKKIALLNIGLMFLVLSNNAYSIDLSEINRLRIPLISSVEGNRDANTNAIDINTSAEDELRELFSRLSRFTDSKKTRQLDGFVGRVIDNRPYKGLQDLQSKVDGVGPGLIREIEDKFAGKIYFSDFKFNNLEQLYRVHSEIVQKVEHHLKILSQRYRDGRITGYSSLPAIKILKDETDRYEYSIKRNEVVFYISEGISEDDFYKLCWLAYGAWFSQNEANGYADEDYGNRFWESSYVKFLQEKQYVNLYEVKDKIVLDAGTGVGMPGILVAESKAHQVFCLDISSFMLKQVEKEKRKRGLDNIVLARGSIFNLPFQDNSFDIVFVNLMLERQPEELRRIALREIKRVLKPEGKIKLCEFYKIDRLSRLSLGWNDTGWLSELKKAGFEKGKVLDRTGLGNGYISYILEAYEPADINKIQSGEVLNKNI